MNPARNFLHGTDNARESDTPQGGVLLPSFTVFLCRSRGTIRALQERLGLSNLASRAANFKVG